MILEPISAEELSQLRKEIIFEYPHSRFVFTPYSEDSQKSTPSGASSSTETR